MWCVCVCVCVCVYNHSDTYAEAVKWTLERTKCSTAYNGKNLLI